MKNKIEAVFIPLQYILSLIRGEKGLMRSDLVRNQFLILFEYKFGSEDVSNAKVFTSIFAFDRFQCRIRSDVVLTTFTPSYVSLHNL